MKIAILLFAAAVVFLGFCILRADARIGGYELIDCISIEEDSRPAGFFHVVVHEGWKDEPN